ncbi:hypothetical protein BK61_05865 [Neisseria gonorrhoeae]|nr:hypothetical protein BK61_05865 [Neisseria gonorrhoeae]
MTSFKKKEGGPGSAEKGTEARKGGEVLFPTQALPRQVLRILLSQSQPPGGRHSDKKALSLHKATCVGKILTFSTARRISITNAV